LRQEEVPEAGGARLGFQRFEQGARGPGVAGVAVGLGFAGVGGFVGVDVVVEEALQLAAEGFDVGGVGEVHGVP
jgi:hypothetical protein